MNSSRFHLHGSRAFRFSNGQQLGENPLFPDITFRYDRSFQDLLIFESLAKDEIKVGFDPPKTFFRQRKVVFSFTLSDDRGPLYRYRGEWSYLCNTEVNHGLPQPYVYILEIFTELANPNRGKFASPPSPLLYAGARLWAQKFCESQDLRVIWNMQDYPSLLLLVSSPQGTPALEEFLDS